LSTARPHDLHDFRHLPRHGVEADYGAFDRSIALGSSGHPPDSPNPMPEQPFSTGRPSG
jgi:hypothetical protein